MSSNDVIRIGLLTPYPEMAEWFCEDVGSIDEGHKQTLTFSNREMSLKLASFPEDSDCKMGNNDFDVFVGILRFVDVVSLQALANLIDASGAVKFTPAIFVFYRNENETDFKMSCPYCGQKLWVRDADQDKRGRCPHCSKGFTLPKQEEHIISALRLPPSVEVKRIIRQDAGSFAAPLRKIIELKSPESSLHALETDKDMTNNQTMKVNVIDEEN